MLVGIPVDPPRYGKHWLDLGFQQEDPATDLRGAGILALWMLHTLHRHNNRNAGLIFRMSRDPRHGFPLAAVSVNATLWTLEAIRTGSLVRSANQCGDLVDSANLFYVGLMYEFYRTWKFGGGTMAQAGDIIKSVYDHATSNALTTMDVANVPDLGVLCAASHTDDCWCQACW